MYFEVQGAWSNGSKKSLKPFALVHLSDLVGIKKGGMIQCVCIIANITYT